MSDAPLDRYCSECGTNITHRTKRARTCSDACRTKRWLREKKGDQLDQRRDPHAQEYRIARDLVMNNVEDEVREVFREEVRAAITERVRENVLGAAETLTELLPKALAALATDVEDKDWMKRSKATAYILKYAMPLMNEDGSKKDLGTIQVVHQIPLPNTLLGEAVADEIVQYDEENPRGLIDPDKPYDPEDNPEWFEKDYPICSSCKQRKPPDMIHIRPNGVKQCSTCMHRENIMYKMADPAADAEREIY